MLSLTTKAYLPVNRNFPARTVAVVRATLRPGVVPPLLPSTPEAMSVHDCTESVEAMSVRIDY
jgi:hypothetical protein